MKLLWIVQFMMQLNGRFHFGEYIVGSWWSDTRYLPCVGGIYACYGCYGNCQYLQNTAGNRGRWSDT